MLVYGYPQGGSTLSITKGIVSRIEFTGYSEDISGVRVQVDAAINPGNSGGPALVDGKMVGLIFSKLTQADNIGYIIPSEEIDLFLKDVADGTYDGKPAMHEPLQTLENDALRSFLGLDKKAQGMVVHAADPADPKDPLKPFDLITKIGDHEIDNVGMVKINDNFRLNFQYLIQKVVKDGKVPLTVVRQGKTMPIDLPVKTKYPMLIESLKGTVSVLLHLRAAGLLAGDERVRRRRSGRFASALAIDRQPAGDPAGRLPPVRGRGAGRRHLADVPPPDRQGIRQPALPRSSRRSTACTIKNLRHMVEMLRDSKEKYTTISFDDRASETIVFDHQEALKATDEILSDNGIREQASEDLAAVWTKKK